MVTSDFWRQLITRFPPTARFRPRAARGDPPATGLTRASGRVGGQADRPERRPAPAGPPLGVDRDDLARVPPGPSLARVLDPARPAEVADEGSKGAARPRGRRSPASACPGPGDARPRRRSRPAGRRSRRGPPAPPGPGPGPASSASRSRSPGDAAPGPEVVRGFVVGMRHGDGGVGRPGAFRLDRTGRACGPVAPTPDQPNSRAACSRPRAAMSRAPRRRSRARPTCLKGGRSFQVDRAAPFQVRRCTPAGSSS